MFQWSILPISCLKLQNYRLFFSLQLKRWGRILKRNLYGSGSPVFLNDFRYLIQKKNIGTELHNIISCLYSLLLILSLKYFLNNLFTFSQTIICNIVQLAFWNYNIFLKICASKIFKSGNRSRIYFCKT